jgi:hypothetical protein
VIKVSPDKVRELQIYVSVANPGTRPVAVHAVLTLGVGLYVEGRGPGGREMSAAVPTYKVVLKTQDFLWLPRDHLYGVRVALAEVFPELAKEGDYRLSFEYANPFRVDMGDGRLPFLGHTAPTVVRVVVSGK